MWCKTFSGHTGCPSFLSQLITGAPPDEDPNQSQRFLLLLLFPVQHVKWRKEIYKTQTETTNDDIHAMVVKLVVKHTIAGMPRDANINPCD